jgi:GABA permease
MRYLVVANQTLGTDALRDLVRDRVAAGPAEFWLVVPATAVNDLASIGTVPLMPVSGGIPSIPGPPEEARRLAQAKLDAALKQLASAGAIAGGEVCDADPMSAVEQAVASREFDEIIVSTLPARLSRWLRQDLPARLERKFHLPITHVAAKDV